MALVDDNLTEVDRERATLAAMANALPYAIVERMLAIADRIKRHPLCVEILAGWRGGATLVRQFHAQIALIVTADPTFLVPHLPFRLTESGEYAELIPAEPTPPPPPPPTPEEIAAMIAALPEGQQQ